MGVETFISLLVLSEKNLGFLRTGTTKTPGTSDRRLCSPRNRHHDHGSDTDRKTKDPGLSPVLFEQLEERVLRLWKKSGSLVYEETEKMERNITYKYKENGKTLTLELTETGKNLELGSFSLRKPDL